jgi:UDP-2,3-diacylglucosamine pyrophosphatase LpxH
MSQDPKLTNERLDEIWADASVPSLKIEGAKYIIFSDFHLGDGGRADDSWENRLVIRKALEYYSGLKYTLLLLGDIEEMWQFDLPEIKTRYDRTIYRAMRSFGDRRVVRVFGNHDGDWCIQPDPAKNKPIERVQATEALKLVDEKGRPRILLVHGHQGDIQSDKNKWSSRIAVRLFRLFEPVAVMLGIVHAPKMRHRVINNYERVMYSWAKKARTILICGHSHNAIFASRSQAGRLRDERSMLKRQIKRGRMNREMVENNRAAIREIKKKIRRERRFKRDILPLDDPSRLLPCYFNSGCGIFDSGITGIEIADGEIRLAKWHRTPGDPRYEVYQHESLADYIARVASGRATRSASGKWGSTKLKRKGPRP